MAGKDSEVSTFEARLNLHNAPISYSIRTIIGTTCLYSSWTGYLKKSDWKTTIERITAADGKLIEVHTSGHIRSSDIIRFVKAISPTTVIPVHTFQPETFQQHFGNVKLLSDGVSWTVE